MAYIPDKAIERAARIIINTRDFCGDERAAVYELAEELGLTSERKKLYRLANFKAAAEWNGWKKAAGVNPWRRSADLRS